MGISKNRLSKDVVSAQALCNWLIHPLVYVEVFSIPSNEVSKEKYQKRYKKFK